MKPDPRKHPWWRFDRRYVGRVKKILPGGSGGRGIAEFEGEGVPSAHIATMMQFTAWEPISALEYAETMPCTCTRIGDVVLSKCCKRCDVLADVSICADVTLELPAYSRGMRLLEGRT